MEAGELLAGRYRLIRAVGSGGMGQVWAGRDTVLDRDVAVKLHRFGTEGESVEVERFLREARVAAALQHPGVVTIYDSGTEGDQAFLVMELLPGPSLQTYVREHGPLPEAEAAELGAQVASGLAAAHGAGVVHRDIKPANLVFDSRGKIKIVDFGIARLTQTTTTSGLTAANMVIGSPPYLSPEQFQGLPADERSDLYALGCVLMTLLTGRPPFEAEHALAYAHQHVSEPPPLVGDRRPDVDPALEAIVGRLLSKDPQDRPGSAREVLDQLRHPEAVPTVVLPEAPEPAVPAFVPPVTEPAVAAAVPPVVEVPVPVAGITEPEGEERPRVRRFVVAAAMVLIVVAALALGIARANAPTHGGAAAATTGAATSSADRSTQSSGSTAKKPTATSKRGGGASTSARDAKTTTSARDATRSASPGGPTSGSASGTSTGTTSPTPVRSSTSTPSASSSSSQSAQPSPTADFSAALTDLRNVAQSVVDGGEITDKKSDDLLKRVDQLSKQLDGKSGDAALAKIDDFDGYLGTLAQSGALTSTGLAQLEVPVRKLRQLAQPG